MPPNSTASTAQAPSLGGAGAEKVWGKYTWEDVKSHNTPDSAWVIIDNVVYDVTRFMDRHPGGREMMLLSAGRECTDLFRMYHWFDEGKRPREVMKEYGIGDLVGATEFPAYAPDSRNFYSDLSRRVRKYFEDTYGKEAAEAAAREGKGPIDVARATRDAAKAATKDPWPATWRLAIMFAVAAISYCVVHGILLRGAPLVVRLAFAALQGVFQAMPLMHAMHDACHTALGPHEGWWKLYGRLCLDWYAGGCMITWHHQHVVGHHVYTNVFTADPDLPPTCVPPGFCSASARSTQHARTLSAPLPSHPSHTKTLPLHRSTPTPLTFLLAAAAKRVTFAGMLRSRRRPPSTPTSGSTSPCCTASWAFSRAFRTMPPRTRTAARDPFALTTTATPSCTLWRQSSSGQSTAWPYP